MALQFTCPEDDCEYSTWAESEDEASLIETAGNHLSEHDRTGTADDVREYLRIAPSPRRSKSGPEAVMDPRRRRAGRHTAEAVVEDGMTVGLGTGSTTAWAIARIGERIQEEGLDVRGVPTSLQSHELAREAEVPIIGLDEADTIHVAIDGADQYSEAGPHVVKGGGAAHAREKVIDDAADRFVIATDEDKATDPMDFPVPVSVLPDGREQARRSVEALGGDPQLRYAEKKDGPVFTANGNLVLDCDFGGIDDPPAIARELSAIPASQEHGLFVDMVDVVYAGTDTDVEIIEF